MTFNGWAQIALFIAILLVLTRPLGGYLSRVMEGERTFLSPVLGPVERGFYRLAGIDPAEDQSWWVYCRAMLVFHIVGFAFLYLLLRLQDVLPLNPQDMSAVAPDLSFNTAVSFLTNTNWQNYGGESTMSYLSQMMGLAVQNFLSAATGIALAMALVRGFARAEAKGIGNFWADLVRVTLYVLLPFCIVLTLFYVWQGVPQNLHAYVEATTLEGAKQTIAQGPVASQLAIKMLGTNGGGFFNANSAHPYENPTALVNLVQMLSIFVIGAALTNVFGRAVGSERQGWAILAAMGVLFLAGVFVAYWAEAGGNPILAALGVDNAQGNMEGKEVRFGVSLSALFAVITTAASCGAVNAMHDSFMPLGGMIPLLNMLLGEIINGGVGAGLYGMLLFAILAIFLAGLFLFHPGARPRDPLPAAGDPGLHGAGRGAAGRPRRPGQRGAAWVQRDLLCLHLGRRQQRQRLRRAHGQHGLLQLDAWCRDDRRPLRHHRADAGGGGLARRQAQVRRLARHLPDRRPVVRGPAGRCHPDRGRAHLPAGARARSHC